MRIKWHFSPMFLFLTLLVALAQKWKRGKDISLIFLARLGLGNIPLKNLPVLLFKVL